MYARGKIIINADQDHLFSDQVFLVITPRILTDLYEQPLL